MSGGQHQAGLQPPFRAVGEEEFAMMFDHDRADERKAQARAAGFAAPRAVPGGVETQGGWPEVWRANLTLRCAARVLVRVGAFRAFHLAQLDKRARKSAVGQVRACAPSRGRLRMRS